MEQEGYRALATLTGGLIERPSPRRPIKPRHARARS